MFVSSFFCKPILCFVLSCGIRVASLLGVDSIPYSKRCSHISMGILILLDHRDCHLNSISNRCVSLRDDTIILPIRKINYKFFSTVFIPYAPSCLCFSRPPTLFLQGLRFLNHVSILWMWSFSILFHQCSYLVILRKMLRKLQVYHSSFSYSFPLDSIEAFSVDYRPFLLSNAFSCWCTF